MAVQSPTLEPVPTQGLSGIGGIANALHRFFNNLTGNLEYQRTANVFKTVQVSAASTAVWTPSASTLKFRLMGFIITLSNNAAISGGAAVTTLTLLDQAAALNLAFDFWVPAASLTTALGSTPPIVITLPGNGILSAVANNVLTATLSTALTTGSFRVHAFGCEE